MSTAIRRSLPFVLGAVLAVGLILMLAMSCTDNGFKYNGVWSGNRNLNRPDLDRTMANTLGLVNLTIKDGKFDLSESSIPTSGGVSYRGNHIELTTETLIGRPLVGTAGADHPTILVTPQPDGTLLFDNPRAIDHKPVVLVRSKSAFAGP